MTAGQRGSEVPAAEKGMENKMRIIITTFVLGIVLSGAAALGSVAHAGSVEAAIKTHKMTGAVKTVDGAKATLVSTDAGIAGSFETSGLNPGHVYTMWVAIMNNPEVCAMDGVDHCTGADVLGRSDEVNSEVTYGDGLVVGADGTACSGPSFERAPRTMRGSETG